MKLNIFRKIKDYLNKRNKQLLRNIECHRLKRMRNKTVPQYKYCKNCGAELHGMYCSQCGQYALDSNPSFWKYIIQYFVKMYSLDGKVWATLWNLLRHPGLLTKEFNEGKIASYVHPVKFLMSVTVVFFLVTFTFVNPKTLPSFVFGNFTSEDVQNVWIAYFKYKNRVCELDSIEANNVTFAMVIDSASVSKLSGIFEVLECSPSVDPSVSSLDTVKLRGSRDILNVPALNFVGEWNNVPLVQMDEKLNDKMVVEATSAIKLVFNYIKSYTILALLLVVPFLAMMIHLFYRKSHVGYLGHFVFSLHLTTMFEFSAILFLVPMYVIFHFDCSDEIELFMLLFSMSGLFFYPLSYMTVASKVVYQGGWGAAVFKTIWIYLSYMITMLCIPVLITLYFREEITNALMPILGFFGYQ